MFHKGKYYITFKRGYEENKRDITVIVDKVFETDCVKITLSDEDDPTFLCTVNITRSDYETLKKQQGLLIDFDNFPSQVVKLFQQCASNNMFLQIQQANPIQYFLEIIEHNEFRRLVHLSLKTGPATDADIKEHMAETISQLKRTLFAVKSSSSSSEALWNDKCTNLERKVHDLSHTLSKMEEDIRRKDIEHHELIKREKENQIQERLQWQKSVEMNTNAQLAISQETMSRKEKQIEDLNLLCKQLRDNISHLEKQLNEKAIRINLLETEVQKTHIEVAQLKARNTTQEKEISEKDKLNNQITSRCTYLEQTLKENSEVIRDLNTSLQILKKEKASLEERLSLSESLANKNNIAAHSTSEQLLKANQIISKQNTDLIEMKEKLLCRTAIALEQEKVIERNTKEIEEMNSKIHITTENLEKVKDELHTLMEKYNTSEQTLKDRDETIKNNNMVIQWLHKKLDEHCGSTEHHKQGMHLTSSSTPYFLSRNNQNSISQEVSDMSINFYATSKSNIEDSPGPEIQNRNGKVGLDPKYLKPASDDNTAQKTDAIRSKSTERSDLNRGKENKAITLPKVDYREKKTSRGSNYKSTPVSAYFN